MSFGAQVHLPALRTLPGVEVRALADGGSGRAAALARDLGAACFADGLSLIEVADIDLVIIATPPAVQASLVLAAIKAGKAVLCEKPFGATLEEAAQMTDAARSTRAVTAVGFQFRYDAGLRRAIEMVQGGAIGPVHRIDVAWLTSGGLMAGRPWSWRHDAREGGILTEFCAHVFDYLALLAGTSIGTVRMTADTIVTERPHGAGRREANARDKVEMLVCLGPTVAHVSVSNAEPVALGHRIEVHGTDGRLTFHHRPPFRHVDMSLRLDTADGERTVVVSPTEGVGTDSRIPATRDLLADLVASMRGDDAPLLPGFAAGLAARRAVAAAEASAFA